MIKTLISGAILCFFGGALAQVDVGKKLTVTMTAYSSTRSQTDSTPFITSTNQRVRLGIVAASRDLLANQLPYGTKLRVVDIQDTRRCGGWDPKIILEVQDTMHKRQRNKLDLWMTSTAEARRWGRCEVTIEVLGFEEETFVQTPPPNAIQERPDLFIEAASKVSLVSFNFSGVTNQEVVAQALPSTAGETTIAQTLSISESEEVAQTPLNIEQEETVAQAVSSTTAEESSLFIEAANKVSVTSFAFHEATSNEILVEAPTTNTSSTSTILEPTYDTSASRTTQTTTYNPPKHQPPQSLMELASQTFLIPILHLAFSTPNTSEEMLNYYLSYYMQNP